MVHRADIDPDGTAPTILSGYGGFRIPNLPSLDPYRLPFLADGGVFALACLRGGSEFGEEWHEDGSREHKEHTFDDFEAAAEKLVDAGYTTPDRLAAWGGSNGGLTVGAALTRRPELFGAMVCNVPLLDMLRFQRFLLGQAWTGEYGTPEKEEEFNWLQSYSPYHHVTEREYPATLFATAAGDTRVHPAHARKMTARVQQATTSDDPICYHSVQETGHGTGTPTSVAIEQALDKWSFIYETLDINRE
ncbi:prolyl oligopeptidase family serine peptidase [Halovenus rubra]|uniref:Prolyl oligopeptidase family serine peptidase n=2 Tax=Halovenus rubra TaxID=869890 RepID=A0ABD5X0A1_9EURY